MHCKKLKLLPKNIVWLILTPRPVYFLFSCCVDEVAAEHVRADCIVHYGPSCLSPCRRLPLLHVFGKRPIDVQQCVAAFKELYPDRQSHVIILYDVTYSHAIGNCYCSIYAHGCPILLLGASGVQSWAPMFPNTPALKSLGLYPKL